MAKKKERAVVLSQTEIATDIYDMWIQTDLAQQARAGQFISIYTQDKSALLPRPISICEIDSKRQALRVVYRILGKGTREFAGYHAGMPIDILGTLGNGFPVEAANGKHAVLLGGGIGIPPMLGLARAIEGDKDIIVGYRNHELFLAKELEQCGGLHIATEDGSVGTQGNVMDAMRENQIKADVIYACGPMPMLRAIKQYAEEHDIPAYISLEERMACGVGACLGCVVKTTHVDVHSHVKNARICTDGPVYLASEVDI